ncbi:MAG: ras-related protein Rab-35 [Terrestrivirus sp.]|uniref:Ras-related protein Rab-35 n=1 Tax=Terrestrivirus sp. TaxID=2487775 RepID=A0A3G4ZQN0_9VIRU|nr:MAG: ras-related protein Rab-35 [Terrestrivirus sp.]
MSEHYDLLIKIICLGDSGVGKSSIISRYVDKYFVGNQLVTLGIDFKIKMVNYHNKNNNTMIVLRQQIWDTGGQERYRAVASNYFRSAHVVLLFFDLTNDKTFKHLDRWISEFNKVNDDPEVVRILVGTKDDLVQDKNISNENDEKLEEMIDTFCETNSCIYLKTSAKNDTNIDILFDKVNELVAPILIARYKNDINENQLAIIKIDKNTSNNTNNLPSMKKKCCT